jgi:DNA-directed RNA polymerase specialized sigma24 family protein
MDLLAKVERDFIARRDSGALARAFPKWGARRESLRCFATIDALIGACRDEAGRSWDTADAVLSALCEEASSGEECAGILLLWLLLPGLLVGRARLSALGALSAEEVTSEMLAGIWEEATRVSAPASRVAARLLNSARWRALAAVRESLDWDGRKERLVGDLGDWTRSSEEELLENQHDGLTGAVREGVLSKEQAELVRAGRRTIREISERLGISLSAAQKRRLRARARLLRWVDRTYQVSDTKLARRFAPEPDTKTR